MALRNYLSFLLLLAMASCNTLYQPTQLEYKHYEIAASQPKDSAMLRLLAPYTDSINKSMNEVVAYAEESLEKAQPSGTLGHFMADVMLYAGKQKFTVPVDAAFVNFGGLRIPQMPKGPVTRSTIFELMPFENLVVVQAIKGAVLQQFLDHIAVAGGWPVAGITFTIKNKKAVDVVINGRPIDMTKTYHIVNSDYVANGGDNAVMLKDIPQLNVGYLMRNAVFDYINALKAEGKNITAYNQNRITHVE